MALSKEERSRINRENAKKAWVRTKKRIEEDPEYAVQWRDKVSNKNRLTEKQREARRQNLIKLNKSKEQRKRSSEAMKKTWKENPKMNERSHLWQEDKERLREVTKPSVEAMQKAFKEAHVFNSKNEKAIRSWLKDLGYHLNSGRILIEGRNRFFDIRIGDLFIEIDGPWHFDEFFDRFKNYERDSSSDNAKENWIRENNYTLIRVSNWEDKLEDQKNLILAYIKSYEDGSLEKRTYYIGEKYEN